METALLVGRGGHVGCKIHFQRGIALGALARAALTPSPLPPAKAPHL